MPGGNMPVISMASLCDMLRSSCGLDPLCMCVHMCERDRVMAPCPLLVGLSLNRLSPLSKHVINQFGHGFWAAGASLLLPLGMSREASQSLDEHRSHFLALFRSWQFTKLASVIQGQLLSFIPTNFSYVAQILFVPNQNHGALWGSGKTTWDKRKIINKELSSAQLVFTSVASVNIFLKC